MALQLISSKINCNVKFPTKHSAKVTTFTPSLVANVSAGSWIRGVNVFWCHRSSAHDRSVDRLLFTLWPECHWLSLTLLNILPPPPVRILIRDNWSAIMRRLAITTSPLPAPTSSLPSPLLHHHPDKFFCPNLINGLWDTNEQRNRQKPLGPNQCNYSEAGTHWCDA